MQKRWIAGLMAAAFGISLCALGAPAAEAGSKGRKNTTIGLGAVALHQLLKGKKTNGLIAGAGAAYAYKRYRDKRKSERRAREFSVNSYGRPYDTRPYYQGYVQPQRSPNVYQYPVPHPEVNPYCPPRTRDDYIDQDGYRVGDRDRYRYRR